MDPITIMLIAGLVTSFAGMAMSYDAQRNAATQTKYNSEYNAKVETMRAEEERAALQQEQRQSRRKALMRRSSIEAAYAKSGLLMTGTPSYVLEEQARADETNILERDRQGDVAYMRSMERAKIIKQQGKYEADALRYGAKTAVISGLGSMAMSGASFASAGGFGSGGGAAGGGGAGGGTPVSGGGTGRGFNDASSQSSWKVGNSLFEEA